MKLLFAFIAFYIAPIF